VKITRSGLSATSRLAAARVASPSAFTIARRYMGALPSGADTPAKAANGRRTIGSFLT
jgi:hypothetical protein